jgi:hypothetical protein
VIHAIKLCHDRLATHFSPTYPPFSQAARQATPTPRAQGQATPVPPLSPNFASEWSKKEVTGYKIDIEAVTRDQFFRLDVWPSSLANYLDDEILELPPGSHLAYKLNVPGRVTDYLNYLKLVHENSLDSIELVAAILKILHFDDEPTKTISHCPYLTPEMGNQDCTAQTNICVIHVPTDIILVTVEDRLLSKKTDPEAQIIAEAIATFQQNNKMHAEGQLPFWTRWIYLALSCPALAHVLPHSCY